MRLRDVVIALLGFALSAMFFSAPLPLLQAQGSFTATPDADGIIYVEVLPNDSLWVIASLAGISLPELLTLNQLAEDAIIHPGDLLIVGHGTPPATSTVELPTPTPTETRPPPSPTYTPTPMPRTALCFEAYEDMDRDGVHDIDEPLRPAVAFTIFNDVTVVGNYITDGVSEPYCLEGMPPGDYKVTRSIGRDETLTTPGNWVLTLTSGSVLNIEFGSLIGAAIPTTAVAAPVTRPDATPSGPAESMEVDIRAPESIDPSPGTMTGILVVLVLLLGGGLLLRGRARRLRSK